MTRTIPESGCRLQSRGWPRVSRLRYALGLVIVVGYVASSSRFKFGGPEYFALSLASLVACLTLLRRLAGPLRITMPAWVLLGLFLLAYYAQFYLLAVNPTIHTAYGAVLRTAAPSSWVLLRTYATLSLAFVSFCVAAWLGLGGLRGFGARASSPVLGPRGLTAGHAGFIVSSLLVATPLLDLIMGYFSWEYDIAVMGAPTPVLPLRLAGFVFYTRFWVLPAAYIVAIWLTDAFGLRSRFAAATGLFVLHAIADSLLRSSRGSLVLAVVMLAFLFVGTGRLTGPRTMLLVFGAILGSLAYPVVTRYRYYRAASLSSRDVAGLLAHSLASTYGRHQLPQILFASWTQLFLRPTGARSLLAIVGSRVGPLGWARASQVTAIFNAQVERITPEAHTSGGPSLVGWFYLIGGNFAVVVGITAFVLVVLRGWKALATSRLRSRPVTQALFLSLLLGTATDGVLDRTYLSALTVLAAVLAVELLVSAPAEPRAPAGRVTIQGESRFQGPP